MVYGVAENASIPLAQKDMYMNTSKPSMFTTEDIFVHNVVNYSRLELLWECTPNIIIQNEIKFYHCCKVPPQCWVNNWKCLLSVFLSLYNSIFHPVVSPHNCITSYHLGSMTSQEIDQLIKLKMIKTENTFCCTDCEYRSQLKCNIEKHIEAQHIRPGVLCKYCSKVCPTRHALRMHLKRNHNTIPSIIWYIFSQDKVIF